MLSDDSESVLLSEEPEEPDPAEQLFELAELSDFCGCADFANKANKIKALVEGSLITLERQIIRFTTLTRSNRSNSFLFYVRRFSFGLLIFNILRRVVYRLCCIRLCGDTAIAFATIFWTEYTLLLQFLLHRLRCCLCRLLRSLSISARRS